MKLFYIGSIEVLLKRCVIKFCASEAGKENIEDKLQWLMVDQFLWLMKSTKRRWMNEFQNDHRHPNKHIQRKKTHYSTTGLCKILSWWVTCSHRKEQTTMKEYCDDEKFPSSSFLILRQDTKLNDHYNPEKTAQHWTQAIRFFVTKTIQNTTLCKKILLIVFWDSNQMYATDTLKLGWLNCVRYIQMLKHLRRWVCLVWQSRAKNSAAQ